MLEYLLQRGEAARALAVLRRPDVSRELFYKFAPGLMAAAPSETVRNRPPDPQKRLLSGQSCQVDARRFWGMVLLQRCEGSFPQKIVTGVMAVAPIKTVTFPPIPSRTDSQAFPAKRV